MTTVYLIRHGETNGNFERRYQGVCDIPLNEAGLHQAALLGEAMKDTPIDVIYASPLCRAFKTAEALAKPHNLPIIVEPELHEINGGLLEGEKMIDLIALYPECMYNMQQDPSKVECPNGETMYQVYERMHNIIEKIVRENVDKSIGIVSHGCAISTYIHYAAQKPFEEMKRLIVANTSICKFTFEDDFIPHTEYIDNHDHLPDDGFIDLNTIIGEMKPL